MCEQSSHTTCEYEGMKTAGDKPDTPYAFRMEKMSQVQHPPKMKKYLSNVHEMVGAHLQCVNNHYAKFENKEMKTVGVTDYINQTPFKHF